MKKVLITKVFVNSRKTAAMSRASRYSRAVERGEVDIDHQAYPIAARDCASVQIL